MAGNENFLQNSSQTAGVNPLNEEQKIQEILQEQQKLQALYNQVVVYIQGHPNMTSDEMLKYQAYRQFKYFTGVDYESAESE